MVVLRNTCIGKHHVYSSSTALAPPHRRTLHCCILLVGLKAPLTATMVNVPELATFLAFEELQGMACFPSPHLHQKNTAYAVPNGEAGGGR